LDRHIFPTVESLHLALGDLSVETVPIPADCMDGFLGAYWQSPEAYLNPIVRSAISTFSRIANVEQGIARASGSSVRRLAPEAWASATALLPKAY